MTAGQKLLAWRKKLGLSQREAAARAGLTKAAWQSYEAGSSPKAPAIGSIQRVTDGEVSLSDWAETEEQKVVRRARANAHRVRSGRPKKADDSGAISVDDDPNHAKAG